MLSSGENRSDGELYSRLRSLIIARLIIGSTLLLGAAFPLEISQELGSSKFLFHFITILLLLSIIYSTLLNKFKNLIAFAYVQLIGDIFLETIVILATGGIESPFSILYVLTIIVASYLIPNRGGLISAFIVTIIFGSVIFLQYKRWVPWEPLESVYVRLPPRSFAIYTIVVNFSGFFLTAILSNQLAERIRKMNVMLKNRNVQYSQLLALNERIVNEIPTGLITATLDGSIVSLNPAASAMMGFTNDMTLPLHLEELFPGYLMQSMLRLARESELKDQTIQFQKSVGSEKRWFQIEVMLLAMTSQDPARIMLICNDITDHKKLETERRKTERWSAIAEISAGMAHEIRNPLASISGSIEVLKDQLSLNTSEKKLMSIILKESERLNRLISDFLDLAKPKPPEFRSSEINNLITETLTLIANSAQFPPNIKLKTKFDSDHTYAEIDSNQITQLLWNVVKNAIDAMPHGGDLMIITKQILEEEKPLVYEGLGKWPSTPYIMISVSDTGIGMEKDIVEKIFEPFATFKRKGVGIGLAIVYRIIENHNGHIHVETSPGSGTTMTVRLPKNQSNLEKKDMGMR
ncbi:PAS domain S-box protein [bacterium]|nr:PAS domain S-box protein [candidate division CSSED10-310 bacterium]